MSLKAARGSVRSKAAAKLDEGVRVVDEAIAKVQALALGSRRAVLWFTASGSWRRALGQRVVRVDLERLAVCPTRPPARQAAAAPSEAVSGLRMVSTGQLALRTTFSVTLPSSRWGRPERPWVPITIRS